MQKRIDRLSCTRDDEQQSEGHDDERAGQGDGQEDVQAADVHEAGLHNIYQVLVSTVGDIEEEPSTDEPELILLDQEQVDILGIPWINKCCGQCCCLPHCRVSNHHTIQWKKATEFTNPFMMTTIVDIKDENLEDYYISKDNKMGEGLTDLLMNVNTNF